MPREAPTWVLYTLEFSKFIAKSDNFTSYPVQMVSTFNSISEAGIPSGCTSVRTMGELRLSRLWMSRARLEVPQRGARYIYTQLGMEMSVLSKSK